MIAALPMYDRPETAAANDRLWELIRAELGYGPAVLMRPDNLWDVWQSPDLLLAQTCGYPYRARLYDRVHLVASPVWDLPDCPPGYYNSVLIARRDVRDVRDCNGRTFAYNEALSQSGWAGPKIWAEAQGLRFGELLQTGAHRRSAQAVAKGQADWAGIDAVTWAMITRYDAFAQDLHIIAQTTPTPALPYITALGQDAAHIRQALSTAIENLPPKDRAILHLTGITWIEPETYKSVPTPAAPT